MLTLKQMIVGVTFSLVSWSACVHLSSQCHIHGVDPLKKHHKPSPFLRVDKLMSTTNLILALLLFFLPKSCLFQKHLNILSLSVLALRCIETFTRGGGASYLTWIEFPVKSCYAIWFSLQIRHSKWMSWWQKFCRELEGTQSLAWWHPLYPGVCSVWVGVCVRLTFWRCEDVLNMRCFYGNV